MGMSEREREKKRERKIEREKKERLIAHWWLFVIHPNVSTITYQKKYSEHWWTCHCYLNVKRENLFEPLTYNTLESIGNYVYITNFCPWNYKWSVCHAHFWYNLYAPSNRNWNSLAVTKLYMASTQSETNMVQFLSENSNIERHFLLKGHTFNFPPLCALMTC